jgi:hypothetical protein
MRTLREQIHALGQRGADPDSGSELDYPAWAVHIGLKPNMTTDEESQDAEDPGRVHAVSLGAPPPLPVYSWHDARDLDMG